MAEKLFHLLFNILLKYLLLIIKCPHYPIFDFHSFLCGSCLVFSPCNSKGKVEYYGRYRIMNLNRIISLYEEKWLNIKDNEWEKPFHAPPPYSAKRKSQVLRLTHKDDYIFRCTQHSTSSSSTSPSAPPTGLTASIKGEWL